MQAFEFSTTIANGMIQLPKSFLSMENAIVRVIVLTKETTSNTAQKQHLSALFARMKSKEMFKSIENPTQWQKKLRDEWD